jgi:hypothetical protein
VLDTATYKLLMVRRHVHSLPLVLAALGWAMAIAACGSSGSGSTDPQASYNVALKFSQCMRAHGLSNFPDPTSGGAIQIGGPGSNLNPESPSFQAAQKACARYSPKGSGPPQMTESQRLAAFKFAKCVRAHGYPDFPDPALSVPKLGAGAGPVAVLSLRGMLFAFTSTFNPQSPAFHQAAAHCGLTLPSPGAAPHANFQAK